MINNETMVRVLMELADILELVGQEPFRVRAFRTAARAIEGMGEPAYPRLKDGSIDKVRGIGDGVIRRLKELDETGTIEQLDDLRKQLPPGLMELMSLPGIGVKTAKQVWKERGVTTIDQLEAAAKDGKLRDLPRFGEKREEKLIAAIAAYRKRASAPKRFPMATALDLAETICARMRAVPHVEDAQFAGSLRRRRDTVGDLDVLVSADAEHASDIFEVFVKMPEVMEVLARGDTKTSVIMQPGIQADMRVIPSDSFGAAIQYFTGSKEHNVAMRTIAVKKKLKVSEYGVFDAKGKKIAGQTEEDVYEAIGLVWMPPELRENRGEIEAAQREELPELVELSDLIGDLHMHTTESDGKSTLEDMVKGALAAGRKYIAITDHSASLTVARGLDKKRLKEHVRRIRQIDEEMDGKIRVLAGLEADILADGSLDLADMLPELDWVVGSVHSHLNMPKDAMTKRVIAAIESGLIDVVGHPFGRMINVREESALDLDATLEALARTGVAIELNASPLRLDIGENGARMARDLGVPICVDSDAHSVRELHFLRYGVGIARRAWLGKEHVLTARSYKALRSWREARVS